MMNNVSLVGRLTKDVDLRYTASGKAVGNFTLAVNRSFKDANGETQADFIPIVVWGKTAENTANFMKKGSQVGVSGGRIQTRHYDNDSGQRVYVTEVIANEVAFLETRNSQGQQQGGQQQAPQQQQNYQQQAPQQQGGQQNMQPIDISDDDLPF